MFRERRGDTPERRKLPLEPLLLAPPLHDLRPDPEVAVSQRQPECLVAAGLLGGAKCGVARQPILGLNEVQILARLVERSEQVSVRMPVQGRQPGAGLKRQHAALEEAAERQALA